MAPPDDASSPLHSWLGPKLEKQGSASSEDQIRGVIMRACIDAPSSLMTMVPSPSSSQNWYTSRQRSLASCRHITVVIIVNTLAREEAGAMLVVVNLLFKPPLEDSY